MVTHVRPPTLRIAALLAGVWFALLLAARVHAEGPPNKLTVENNSGDPVHAELIGPSAQVIDLADGENRTVNVAAGEYSMQVRYGNDPKKYTYSKVAPFKIEQTATTYMAATITIDCLAERFPEPVP